jgi:hypothetical protein
VGSKHCILLYRPHEAPLTSKAASYIHGQPCPGLNQTLHRSQLDRVATAAGRLVPADPRYQIDQTHSSSLGGLVIYPGSESVVREDFLLHFRSRRSKMSLDMYQNKQLGLGKALPVTHNCRALIEWLLASLLPLAPYCGHDIHTDCAEQRLICTKHNSEW